MVLSRVVLSTNIILRIALAFSKGGRRSLGSMAATFAEARSDGGLAGIDRATGRLSSEVVSSNPGLRKPLQVIAIRS